MSLSVLEHLAQQGAQLLRDDPDAAPVKFGEAHELALRLGDSTRAALLSVPSARAWSRKGSLSQSLRLSRRGISENGGLSAVAYTLAHLCEVATERAEARGERRTALTFLRAAIHARLREAATAPEEEERDRAAARADDLERAVLRLRSSSQP